MEVVAQLLRVHVVRQRGKVQPTRVAESQDRGPAVSDLRGGSGAARVALGSSVAGGQERKDRDE